MSSLKKNITFNNIAASASPAKESPRKCDLSFSFNFDLDAVISESSTDSETNLQIDVAEIDDNEPTRKRPRIEIEETSAINEMEEEIERQLDAKAAKTNLTATNVKNILKHVITNEHVLAMVQNRMQNTSEGMIFEPKLTRAKAKELALMQPNMPWPITPIKKTSSLEVQELIEKDLSEDSSDEEYSPEQDQQSDDEAEGDHLTNSDIDSQPSTPANSGDISHTPEKQAPVNVHYDSEGLFKIPEVPHVPTEVESIGQRTRSKLCLSETPLEQIEQAFIPPDITTDMYDWDCDIDEDWGNFLNEFTKPLGHDATIEDDPEADPEYNILEDKETDLLDKEELRMDKAVKVTRKELNNLVAELFEFEDIYSKQQIEQIEVPKKKKSVDNSLTPPTNNSMNNCMVDLLPALAEPELPRLVSDRQVNLLATQLRQHVQLMTQHFGMSYMHPELNSHAKTYKENLNSLSYLKDGSDSAFNVENLPDALKLVNEWETKLQDPKFREEYTEYIANEIRTEQIFIKRRCKYEPKFHPELIKLFIESKALMYPQLLPHTSFRTTNLTATRAAYSESEVALIALGLEEFTPFVAAKKTKFKAKKMQLMDVASMICQYMLPCRIPAAIFRFIQEKKNSSNPNPIKHYYTTGSAPRTIHYITIDCQLIAPKDQPREILPEMWRENIKQLRAYTRKSLRDKKAQCSIERYDLLKPSDDTVVNESLRNPVVNMLPSVTYNPENPETKLKATAESSEDGTSVDESSETLRSPQLRKTTPRLAKIRSAQNMKLMTQVSSGKPPSNCSRVKSRAKSESSKDSEESCGSTKGDNEDEIAELMLASTTIKKDTASRKKAKQARELENIKRLREADNETAREERDTKFAESYIQKLLVTLESSNMETLKAVIKSYSEYSDKFDNLNHTAKNEMKNLNDGNLEQSINTKEQQKRIREEKDILTINLYKEVCNHLRDYPELRSDFLLFLKPHHAAMIDELTEHTMLHKMNEFMNVAQIYFAKQPSRLARLMKAITQLASDRYVTMADVHAAIDPILRGHPLVMDMFLQVLPTGKPPNSLFASHLFENLTCPMGPYDKHKVYTEDSPELYENIELPLPTSQEDPYGGDNCKCDCHDSSDPNLKTVTEHCVSCGTRFLNGKIYLQTSEGLRPAKITFPGDEEEKLENIIRVSLKTTERFSSAPPTSRRRKSSKNESVVDESSQKQCTTKNSPIKDIEESGEKSTSKSRRGARSPPKTADQRKFSKATDFSSSASTSAASGLTEPTSPLKSKRETRAERREAKLELKNVSAPDINKIGENAQSGMSEESEDFMGRAIKSAVDSSDSEANVSCEKMDTLNIESDNDFIMDTDDPPMDIRPWTRHEDMTILQNIKKDYSESTFVTVSAMLGNRTVEQVKQRCQTLLNLLEKMI